MAAPAGIEQTSLDDPNSEENQYCISYLDQVIPILEATVKGAIQKGERPDNKKKA